MTSSQKELREYLLYVYQTDRVTPEETLHNLWVASYATDLPLALKPIVDNYLSLSDSQVEAVKASLH